MKRSVQDIGEIEAAALYAWADQGVHAGRFTPKPLVSLSPTGCLSVMISTPSQNGDLMEALLTVRKALDQIIAVASLHEGNK